MESWSSERASDVFVRGDDNDDDDDYDTNQIKSYNQYTLRLNFLMMKMTFAAVVVFIQIFW